ncbi:MAG: hypothetical protein RIU71_1656 [Pseudomonadota bacterium]|jgi:hypothetical protein
MFEHQKKMVVGPDTTTTTNTKPAVSKALKSTKLANILRQLVTGQTLNRFEAEHHHDHCLNSTVSALQNGHGIAIERERESVPCLGGVATVSVNRYWLNTKPENIKRARDLLAYLERRA